MEPWQQRVVDEQRELAERMQKLWDFIRFGAYDTLPDVTRGQMCRQMHAMKLYDEVLRERILDFAEA